MVIVSSDTHIGPRLQEDLRPYCPREHLDTFDEHAARSSELKAMLRAYRESEDSPLARNATDGHHDMRARLRDMDRDGVAAEVIFHGSQNTEGIPFAPPTRAEIGASYGGDLDLVTIGFHIYNQWLADAVSIEPERHIGLAQLPMWDIDARDRRARVGARRRSAAASTSPPPRAHLTPYNDLGVGAVLVGVRGPRRGPGEPRWRRRPAGLRRDRWIRDPDVGARGARARSPR